jgi:L-asparaginase II
MQVKLSVTSKLDGIRSWSLQALETCPGSIASDGELVDACKGCYATQCRACWDQSVPVIGYVAHGKSMSKVIKLKVAA